jgi:Spy/CpxP family protein refolding chaperone
MNKKRSVLAVMLALLFGLTIPRVAAQTGTSAVDPETKAQVQSYLQQMSSELNLTDSQKTQIKPILQSEFQQLKSVKDDTTLSPEQQKAKAQEIHAAAKSQIGSVLTPEQQKKLATMREQGEAPK